MKLTYLRETLPQLPGTLDLAGIQGYLRQLSIALAESQRSGMRAFSDIDCPPVFLGTLAAVQSFAANTLTTTNLVASIDTHGWFGGGVYVPKEAGFYRCSWAANFNDPSAAIAATTYAMTSVNGRETVQYGNGSAQTIGLGGSTIVECDGASTGISLNVFLLAGTPTLNPPARTWLAIDYLGKRAI